MTTSWITQLSMEPVLIGVGIDNSAVTHRLIREGVVHGQPRQRRDPSVREVLQAGRVRRRALNGRAVHDGVTGAPIFDEAIAWMECEVRQAHHLVPTPCSSVNWSTPRFSTTRSVPPRDRYPKIRRCAPQWPLSRSG